MPAQGKSVAIPWGTPSSEPANAESVGQDLEPGFANAFSVRTRSSFVYPGYKPWAKIRELFRSSTTIRELFRSSTTIRQLFRSSTTIRQLLRSSTSNREILRSSFAELCAKPTATQRHGEEPAR